MNLKITFLAVVSSLLLASCGTSSVDSKKCVSHTRKFPSSQVIDTYVYTFNYSDSKLVGYKNVRTNMAGDIDSILVQVQYDNNNLVESTNYDYYSWNSPEVSTDNLVFEYDSEERMKSVVRKAMVDGNVYATYNNSYFWSNNDLTVDMFVDVDADSSYMIRTYHFNSFGQIVEVIYHGNQTSDSYCYDDKNSPFKNIIFPLRMTNTPIRDKINNITGCSNSSLQYNYTYDDDDFPTSLDIVQEDGTIYSTDTWTYE